MMVRAEDILEQAARWCADGHMVALATVIETWGSSPRPVGSQLVISNTRQFAGSVSGGCIEGAVVGEAIKVIASGKSTTLKFNVSDEEALNIGLTCGGSVSVLINPVDPDGILKELALNIAKRTPLSIITKLSSGEQSLASAANHPDTLSNELVQSGLDAINSRVSSIKDDAGEQYFIHAFPPAPRIFVVGAGHIAQALCPMANIAGFDVTIIDPRPAFITEQRFPG
ncbi:MAG: XdhC family protein, partial [Rhodospirillales bacterium]|nr:XdhC family protein [Rhodospirillales bacterium]